MQVQNHGSHGKLRYGALVLSKDAAQFQFGRAHQLEEFKVALRDLRVHVDVHGNLSRWGIATPHSDMQDRIRQELNAAVSSCRVPSPESRVPIPNEKDDEIDEILHEISEISEISTDTTDITHPEIAPQNEPASPDPSPRSHEAEVEQPALLEMTTDERLKSLMAALQPDHPRRANEDAARAATAAAVSRQSAFRPCLPPITELTSPTPAPSTRTELPSEETETPPKRKANEESQTNKDTPPQKKPAKPRAKPRAKAKKADGTPTQDAPQPAKSQPEGDDDDDVACAKCGARDENHTTHGEMLLCSARIGSAYCTAALHVACAGLKKVPKDKWYCAEHATTGAGCPLGCECHLHRATGKRTRRPALD